MSFQGEPSTRENCHGQTCGSSLALDHEAALLDFGDRIRRRRLDPVDLAGQQRRGAGIGFRHRQQHHLVDLGNARLVPVVLVLDQFEPFARREARHLPGAGARGVLGERRPGGLRFRLGVGAFGLSSNSFAIRRAGHEQIGQVDRQETVRLLGGQFHRHVVDLAAEASVGMREAVTPTWLASNCGASCFSTFSTFQTTASALNGEPSWKLTPGRSLKVHFFLSASSTFHSVARPGDHHARLVGRRQVPHRQRVVHGEAGEAVALKALIGLAERARNIGGGHADAQHRLRRWRAAAARPPAPSPAATPWPSSSISRYAYAAIPFRLGVTNSYATGMQRLCQGRPHCAGANSRTTCG